MTGSLCMVSVGPGIGEHITPAARAAIARAGVVVSYDLYLTWIRDLLTGKEIITHPLTEEKARATAAIAKAREGHDVAIVSSGDIGVYGMASLVFEEMQEADRFDVSVVPGVTAANACASILGAPLAHDYLVLSLSDLLCPWDWIEERARCAAQADVCMALYNVCSKKRPDGIYKLLDVIACFKSSETICGVVRNAYRPDQSSQILSLGELRQAKFDMLTSIIIGNKFTRRKRKWMFTPRGYNDFVSNVSSGAADTAADAFLPTQAKIPQQAVWVFSGTSDGNQLAQHLREQQETVVISAATEYGAMLARRACPSGHVVAGRIGKPARKEVIRNSSAKAVVDATHPYADSISRQLIELSEELRLPYIRFERPASSMLPPEVKVVYSLEEALHAATAHGRRIFLACGSKGLESIDRKWAQQVELFLRIPPDGELIRRAVEFGIPPTNIIAMQGPFSQALNEALWRDLKIHAVISKESGAAGGFESKLAAAREIRIPLYVISRPKMDYPCMASSFAEVATFLAGVNQ